jgi:hypothetical protein
MAKPRPVRLHLSRAKGFNLQKHSRAVNGLPAVNAARPGKLGNPFKVGRDGTRQECVAQFGYIFEELYCRNCTPSVREQEVYRDYVLSMRERYCGHNIAC